MNIYVLLLFLYMMTLCELDSVLSQVCTDVKEIKKNNNIY